ncbi:MAG: DMT family transporter [Chloroflexota bacterium]
MAPLSSGTVATRYLALAAAAGASVLVGLSVVATRFAIRETTPASLALLRYAVALVLLAPFVLATTRVSFERRDLVPVAVLGVLQFGVLIVLLNYGAQTVPGGRVALLFATTPLLTLGLSWAVGQEHFSRLRVLALVITVAGVAVSLGDRALAAGASWIGDLAVLGSAITGAICNVGYRPYVRRYPTLAVNLLAILAAVVFLALPAAADGFFVHAPSFSPLAWLAVLFIGASSAVGYYLWLWAIKHLGATTVSAYLGLSPITAAAMGGVLLGEAATPSFLVGLGLVMAGLWGASRA